jgi:hypothetical protein
MLESLIPLVERENFKWQIRARRGRDYVREFDVSVQSFPRSQCLYFS